MAMRDKSKKASSRIDEKKAGKEDNTLQSSSKRKRTDTSPDVKKEKPRRERSQNVDKKEEKAKLGNDRHRKKRETSKDKSTPTKKENERKAANEKDSTKSHKSVERSSNKARTSKSDERSRKKTKQPAQETLNNISTENATEKIDNPENTKDYDEANVQKSAPEDVGYESLDRNGEQETQEKEEAHEKEESEHDEYAEDFEDYYDDDFEDELAETHDTFETSDVGRAEQDVQTPASPHKTVASSASHRTDSKQSVTARYNFSANAARSEHSIRATGKMSKREEDIRSLIEFDRYGSSVYEMAPAADYDDYSNSATTNRVAVQTGNMCVDRENQCEALDQEQRWTQCPPTSTVDCGGGDVNETTADDTTNRMADSEILNQGHFQTFVAEAGRLIISLLHDASLDRHETLANESDVPLATSYSVLPLSKLTSGDYSISAISFSPQEKCLLATTMVTKTEEATSNSRTVIWDTSQTDTPVMLLAADSPPQALCFSSIDTDALFGGLADGSVIAYDLHEFPSRTTSLAGTEIGVLDPAYDTANYDINDGAMSAIVGLTCGSVGGEDNYRPTQSYQVAGLDATSTITIWTVLTVDKNQISESDFGQRPGSRIRMVKTIKITQPLGVARSALPMRSFCIVQLPNKPNSYFVGTDSGYILQATRPPGQRSGPKFLKPFVETQSDVISISVNCFAHDILAAGSSDGVVRLYSSNSTSPLLGLYSKPTSAVLKVEWSPCSPYICYVLHEDGYLREWNLKHSYQHPEYEVHMQRATDLHVSRMNSNSGGKMAVSIGNVEIRVYLLKAPSTKYKMTDGTKLKDLFDKIAS